MIKIGICDDNLIEQKNVGKICREYSNLDEIEMEIQYFNNGEEVLRNSEELDVLFLDVEMPKMNGIEVKERLEQMNTAIQIIFITSHYEVMQEAFGKNVCNFLLKPLKENDVILSLKKVLSLFDEENYVSLKTVQGNVKVRVDDIKYIESVKHYCSIYLQNQTIITVREKISELAVWFEKHNFFYCHKSYIVNLLYIAGLKKEIELVSGESIPVSRKYKKSLKTKYCEYIQRQVRMPWEAL